MVDMQENQTKWLLSNRKQWLEVIIVYKLLGLDRYTWNPTTVCKLFVLDRKNN